MIIYNFNRETPEGLRKFQALLNPDSWLFQAVEREFDSWIDDSNPASEYEEKYFGDDAIYTKRGAIQGAIEQIFEELDESEKPFIHLKDVDLSCSFAD